MSQASPSSVPFLPFALPEIGEDDIAEVVDTLRSGWVTTGPKAKRFEADFQAFLGDAGDDVAGLHCIAVNSATAGLHLALEAMGIGPGDEVITTTHTFTATAEVVRYLGADVKLVDIDPATLNIDPTLVEAAITPRTKAIIPVHYAGLAADMPAILAMARKHGLKVVEDAAHALPTTSAGQRVGTLASDATVFSFYANKTITTGEGGMLVTRDVALASRARVMRLHGMSRDAFDRFTATVPSWYYEIVAPGFKYNLTDIAAALGIHQLKKAHVFAQRRAAMAAQFNAAFADLPVITAPPWPRPANCTPGTCTCCACCRRPASRVMPSSSGCTRWASAAACTTSRCTCSPTGATATRCAPPTSRTASRPTNDAEPAALQPHDRRRRAACDQRGARAAGGLMPLAAALRMAKRLFDIAGAAVALLLLAPLLLLVALAVRLDSPGPVFFRQERVGRGGVPFRIHKFRTMRADAPALGPQVTVERWTRASPAWATGCAAGASTSCRSSSTCCWAA